MTKAKKRIMREFALDEISAVTVPAQTGAKMVLMKRAAGEGEPQKRDISKLSADEIAALVLKGECALTNEVNGHSHLIDLDTYTRERGGGFTSTCWCEGGSDHSHPFVVSEGGKITIGMAQGHTHEVMTADAVKAAAGAPVSDSTQETDMDQKELAKLQALAVMTDAQKDYFGKLSSADAEAFIAASPTDRAALVTKAAGPDPVVYKSRSGAEYRASIDPQVLSAVKEADAAMAALEVEKAARFDAQAVDLAKSWTHMGEPLEEKIVKAKAILSAPEVAQKAALDAIEAHRKAVEPFFTSHGTRAGSSASNIGKADSAEAEEELNKMANDHAAQHNVSYEVAFDAVLQTRKGGQLYSKANPRMGSRLN